MTSDECSRPSRTRSQFTLNLCEAETGIVLKPDGTYKLAGEDVSQPAFDTFENAVRHADALLEEFPLAEVWLLGPGGEQMGGPRRSPLFDVHLAQLKVWRRWRNLPWLLRVFRAEPPRPGLPGVQEGSRPRTAAGISDDSRGPT